MVYSLLWRSHQAIYHLVKKPQHCPFPQHCPSHLQESYEREPVVIECSVLAPSHCSLQLYCDTEKPAGREHRKQWWSLFNVNRFSGSGHTVTEHWPWAQEMAPIMMGHLAGVTEFSPVRGQSFTIFFSRWRLFLVKGYRGISMQLCCVISTHKGCAWPKSDVSALVSADDIKPNLMV